MAHGTETILLVEDELSVSTVTQKILMFGYRVLVASQGGVEAQNLFSANKSEIAL